MRNTWGVEEEEDGDSSGEDSGEEAVKMEEEQHKEDKSRKGLLINLAGVKFIKEVVCTIQG